MKAAPSEVRQAAVCKSERATWTGADCLGFIDATAADGVWTLSANEIARISYVTTFQYALALLQFNASQVA